jgi:hypothetical protein
MPLATQGAHPVVGRATGVVPGPTISHQVHSGPVTTAEVRLRLQADRERDTCMKLVAGARFRSGYLHGGSDESLGHRAHQVGAA